MRRLTIGVAGCSGTGSPVIEQLSRYQTGNLVIADDDHMEARNINRILNSTVRDAHLRRPKVDVLADAIRQAGLGTQVRTFRRNIWDREVVQALAECDILFGCMDTVSGRFLLNKIAAYYLIPYFDIGVKIDAVTGGGESGRVRDLCGTVHYLQPDGSSLISRGLVSLDRVNSEMLERKDPAAFKRQLADGYIRGVANHAPAVMTLNLQAASHAVADMLARIHPYREVPNKDVASIEFSLGSFETFVEPEGDPCTMLSNKVGLGDVEPLLGLMELAEVRAA